MWADCGVIGKPEVTNRFSRGIGVAKPTCGSLLATLNELCWTSNPELTELQIQDLQESPGTVGTTAEPRTSCEFGGSVGWLLTGEEKK